MVHPSAHNTPNDISGAIFIYSKIWIFLTFFLRPDIWSVAICDDSIVLTYVIFYVMSFEMMTGAIVVVACFSRYKFALESEIAIVFLLGEFGGVSIQFIKLVLGLLI